MTATVLIADDDPDIVELIAALLSEEGLQPVPCHDGLAALRHIRAQRPAVAIIDLAMPVMEGRELIERLRREPGPPIPVIAMSAAFYPSDTEILAADAYLTKPFDLEELLEQVNYFISRRDGQSAHSAGHMEDEFSLMPARQQVADNS